MAYSAEQTGPATAITLASSYLAGQSPRILAEQAGWTWRPTGPAGRDQEDFDNSAELAHANRVAMLGQLSASIAHEVNQPIAAVITNAQTALRLLTSPTPNMEVVRQALARIVRDGHRAGEVVGRIRAMARKESPTMDRLDVNEAIREAIALTHGEVVMSGVTVNTKLAGDVPFIRGDRVQLQQVMVNLIINAVEAMGPLEEGPRDGTRELLIRTARTRSGGVLVAVRDHGPGVEPADLERIFEAFYSTKPDGLGMGLSICRSIIQAHGGRLWATRIMPRGTTFQFSLPADLRVEQ